MGYIEEELQMNEYGIPFLITLEEQKYMEGILYDDIATTLLPTYGPIKSTQVLLEVKFKLSC